MDETPKPPTAPFRNYWAFDLTSRPALRGLWRLGEEAQGESVFPGDGLISPLGFRLYERADDADEFPGARLLRVRTGGPGPSEVGPTPAFDPTKRSRPTQSVRLSGDDGDLTLTINALEAIAVVSEGAWGALAEPLVLAVCLYWRSLEIDQALDDFTRDAVRDLDHATLPRRATRRDRERLFRVARGVRAFLVDLPYFQGPLIDPMPYVATERSARTFADLAERLHLRGWSEAIDKRAEAVADIYEAVAEKLFESRKFARETALTAVIIVVLLAGLAVMIVDVLRP